MAIISALAGIEDRPDPERRVSVALISLGRVEDVSLEDVGAAVERVLPVRCTIGQGVSGSQVGYDAQRDQYLASAVLEHHESAVPEGPDLALFVTEQDLYQGELNFVLGLADADKGCCVVSLARMRLGMPRGELDRRLLQDRAEKTAVHELGHVFGLRHCPNRDCVMAFSNTVGDTDRKRCWLCDTCRKKLNGLVSSKQERLGPRRVRAGLPLRRHCELPPN